jgi:AbrB family looped-hinge helix DNA binding protein
MESVPRREDVYHVSVDHAGRMLIPAAARQRYGIHQGDRLVVSADESGLHVMTLDQAIERAQASFARFRKPGVSMVDELLRERREEAARE